MFCVRTEPLSSRSLTFLAPVIQILRETDFSSFLRGCQQAWKKKAVTSSDGLFLVCRAWRITWRCKSFMEVCSNQPLVNGKGVPREVESEGSRRQSSGPRNTNSIRHTLWDEFAWQNKILKLHGHRNVNAAGIWNEGYSSYHGRSHGRVETGMKHGWNKIYREKSAEAIVAIDNEPWEKKRKHGGLTR